MDGVVVAFYVTFTFIPLLLKGKYHYLLHYIYVTALVTSNFLLMLIIYKYNKLINDVVLLWIKQLPVHKAIKISSICCFCFTPICR